MAKAKVICKECGCRCEYSYATMGWYCPDCTEKKEQGKPQQLADMREIIGKYGIKCP